jgi:WD40 repeat protein
MKTVTKILVGVLVMLSNTIIGQHKQAAFIPLKGNALYPEGILALNDGSLLVGGFGDGSIQKIQSGKEAVYFSAPGANGMTIAVGMAADTKNNRLWVANFNFKTASGKPGSNLKVFDLKTGNLLRTIPESYIEGVFFNEVVVQPDGNVYVTNTFGPQIWNANFSSSAPTVFVENELLSNPDPAQPFDLNGLSSTPDNEYLIASVMDRLDAGDGRLVRIHLKSKEVTPIQLNGGGVAAFAGSDGMFFHNGILYMVNVYAKAGAILTATFSNAYSSAELTVHLKHNDLYDRPTASAISKGRLYTVNSQLNRIIDDADGKLNTAPSLPFKVVSIPLSEIRK